MSIRIGAGRWEISLDDAKAAVAGYAFAERKAGDELAPRWGYRTFDCIPASPGAGFSDLDILVAAGLNAQLGVNAIGALQVATRQAGPLLAAAAERGPAFTELPLEELADAPPPGSTGWLLAGRSRGCGSHDHRMARAAPDLLLRPVWRMDLRLDGGRHHRWNRDGHQDKGQRSGAGLRPISDRDHEGLLRHAQRRGIRDAGRSQVPPAGA